MLHEYALEVKLAAVCRVKAANRRDAELRMRRELEGVAIRLAKGAPSDVRLTQASMDDASPLIIEVDGKDVEA